VKTKYQNKIIWTIGHSTRTFDEFLTILKSFNIELIADVRRYPGSKKYPHFNKDVLKISLSEKNIEYIHFEDLGGRRKPKLNSINTAWRHSAFRGYADYMESDIFKEEIKKLERIASKKRAALMCSEAVWWRCHRSLISDYLKVNGWTVIHIMSIEKGSEHPFTSPAKIINGKLIYKNE
jgi:uncharacterized protein (DUF488 family)